MTKFKAKDVESFKQEFSHDFAVFNIFFEESDPEMGGESWNFQRALGADGKLSSFGEDDEGVCTVKEVQQATLYEGIKSIVISRGGLVCVFEDEATTETKTSALEIEYEIDESTWEKLNKSQH